MSTLNHRGYAVLKEALSKEDTDAMKKALTVRPNVAPGFGKPESFPLYFESQTRWYLPRFWGLDTYGEPDSDSRSPGLPLRPELTFQKTLRPEQLPIVEAFKAGDYNGLICVPCGFGKTFMAIWLACQLRKRFLVVVHQEFLMEQWRKELEVSIPGIRIGVVQQDKVQIGVIESKPPTIEDLKTRLRARGLKVGGTKQELIDRLKAVEPPQEAEYYDCCICMIQTVAARDWPAATFADFGFTIFDECHHLGAEHFSKALVAIQTKHMLGLSATPKRLDGLDNVFLWFLGPIRYQIKVREADDTVVVKVLKFTSADDAYADEPTNFRGEVNRARLCNQLAEYEPRTIAIANELEPALKEGRKLLILSDRRSHLEAFEKLFRSRGFASIGYYVGGMTSAARDESATEQIILATFTLAAEGMNIRDLNTVALVTPKSRIEQAVGRVFRLKKEERTFAPEIYDVLDVHDSLKGQYRKRLQFYKQCAYKVVIKSDTSGYKETKNTVSEAPSGVPMFRASQT
jgi:superfamily II DNA or RNA helicase